MANADRGPSPDLIAILHREGRRPSFVQALRLLRFSLWNAGEDPEAFFRDRLRIRPHLSMGFAETDIADFEALEGDPTRYRLTVQFLGLYGSGSPLPTFYTEDLLEEQGEGFSGAREFLDLLNAPLYPLRFRIWAKHRLAYHLVEAPDPAALERIFDLLGLGGEAARAQVSAPLALLRYVGLLAQQPRSAEGLRCLLADRFELEDLRIESCVPRTATIPADQRCLLGHQAHRLGDSTVIGDRVADRTGAFRIEATGLDEKGFQSLLPGASGFTELAELVRLYLDQPLVWNLRLGLKPGEARTANLGNPSWGLLGMNTWLLPPAESEGARVADFPEPVRGDARLRQAGIDALQHQCRNRGEA